MAAEITPTKREVIEDKLLVALSDDDKVACVLTREDLNDLIYAMSAAITLGEGAGRRQGKLNRYREMLEDLKRLRSAAFGTSH